MTRPAELLAVVALVVLGLAGYGYQQRKIGRMEAERVTLLAKNDSLAKVQAKVDTIYARQTRTLEKVLTVYDTVRVTETIVRNDTVFIPRIVADRAIEACRQTVLSCDESRRIMGERIKTLEAIPAFHPPSPFRVWGGRAMCAGIGYTIGRATR